MSFLKIKVSLINVLILSSFSLICLCLNETSKLLFQFKGKSLHKEEDPDTDENTEPYWEDDSEYPIFPPKKVYNSSTFISEWFYNGMYTFSIIGAKKIESYINMQNSKLSIEKCNINRAYSKTTMTEKSYYKPLTSETYMKKNAQTGNDIFYFAEDFKFQKNIQIGESKGNGLDFYFNEEDNDYALCGNFGFNLNLDETNLISQLKKKNYINKYIWTLKYQTIDDGIIILGTEPHFYDNNTFKESHFFEIKAVPKQSPDTDWSFVFDEVRTYDNKTKIVLSQNKADFLIDRGLIIGTDEYKMKIDELVFNDLINEKICYREIKTFHDYEKKTDEEYYIYYCSTSSFMKNKYTIEKTYYNTFPSIEFFDRESNMTFSLTKEDLFYIADSRMYFLVIFKKSIFPKNIWKLGEPFFLKNQFTFNQEKKSVGFYSNLERKSNGKEDYNENNGKRTNLVLYIVIIIILVILLIVLAYFLGKKLSQNRKKRANELNDDEFEYTSEKKANANNNEKDDDSLLIN